jgi:two-component system, NarL family, nitrate/nitrite response regulator NarL
MSLDQRANLRPVRVIAIDPYPLYCDGVARVVRQDPAMQLVAEADHAATATAAVLELRPDVVVLDPTTPRLDARRLLALIERHALPTRVIVFAAPERAGDAYRALALGAAGCLSKRASKEQLADAIHRVKRGETVIAPELHGDVAADIRIREAGERPVLSPRERQVLELAADGLTMPEMGSRLDVSTATVKTHMLHLYEKLGVSERAAAVAQAMRRGILE